jgi:DNA modification methylase
MQMPGAAKQDFASTAEVARRAGVHRDTLLRWLRRGLVREPGRDRHGWRAFSEEQVRAIVAFAKSSTEAPVIAETREGPRYAKALNEIDWDFQDAKTNYLTHRIHPYPAKFIPQIPNALIQELSSVGDTVGDIFCGSGTTLVEALTLKRHAVGIDANPLACLIASAKISAIKEAEREALQILAAKSRKIGDTILTSASDGDLFPTERFVSTAWRPDFEKLPFWFEAHVIEELAEVVSWCRALPSGPARNLALTSFSSIVVAVSRQDSDTRYVRREKNIPQGDTMRRFGRALEQATLAAMEFSDMAEPRFKRHIIEANLLDAPQIPALDLVVCSPPYPNAYSYHLYHMTRMIWLGMNQLKFKRDEIGSHRKYSSPGKNSATAETFRSEFTTIFSWLARYLKKGGHACFIVGNSTLKGETFNNADILSEASRAAGFRETMRISRTMQSTKKAFNPVIGKIKQEQILILENTGGRR